jgi:hypothetical protein
MIYINLLLWFQSTNNKLKIGIKQLIDFNVNIKTFHKAFRVQFYIKIKPTVLYVF